MMYELVQTKRGKEKVVLIDQLSKVNDRMKTLRSSHRKGIRGEKVTYFVRESTETEKYKKKPNNMNLSGDGSGLPKRVK